MRWIHEVTSTYLLQDDVVSTSLLCVELRIFTHWTRGLANQRKRRKEWDFDGCVFEIAIQSFIFLLCCVLCIWNFHTHISSSIAFFPFISFYFISYIGEVNKKEVIAFALFTVCIYFIYWTWIQRFCQLFYVLFFNRNKINKFMCCFISFFMSFYAGSRYLQSIWL